MKKKIGTVMDERLLRQAKQVAFEEGKKLQDVFSEGVKMYVARHEFKRTAGSMVRETAGILPLDVDTLHRLLRDEPGVLDA